VSDAPPSSDAGGTDRSPIWARPVRGSRGPAPTHSRDAIAAAGVLLADQQGLTAVSMRAVATALGTSAGSLYRYLSSRDDLLDLMTDRVMGELRPYRPSEGDWLDTMLLVARDQRALYPRHRWLLDVMQRPSSFGPESLSWFDHCLRILEPVRCGVTAKFEAIAMMTGVVSLFARSETTSRSVTFGLVDPAAAPYLEAALRQPPGPSSPHDLLERTLRILLTGLLGAEPPDDA
jgi:AcrR family transcriptional regulator